MYKIVKTETSKIGRFEIVLDTINRNGIESPYSYVRIVDGVCVVTMIDDQVLLLQEYRHAIKKTCYEFPCGMIDKGEKPVDAAIREVKEETGFLVEEIIDLGYFYPSFGSTTEKIYLFFAKCKGQIERELDNLEEITWQLIDRKEIDKMILENKIVCGAAIAAWLKWKLMSA